MSPWPPRERAVRASSEITVLLPEGVALHARPAGAFVKTALSFAARVVVASDGKHADAKSILAVLALGARGGTALRLFADGDDAAAAIDALAACVRNLTE